MIVMIDFKALAEIRLKELGLGAVEAATSVDVERTFIRDIIVGRKKTVRADKLPILARALRLNPEALLRNEIIRLESQINDSSSASDVKPSVSNASFPPQFQRFPEGSIPLLGQTAGGANGRFILNGAEVGRVFIPPSLEGVENAYAVRVYGTSMEPRYFAGETVWLNPNEPVRKNDDVVVQVITDEENGRESYIKRFVSQSSKLTRLYQYNPEDGEEAELTFPTDQVFSIHKIVFHANT
ncbi:repressor protein C [Rhizobium sp. L51/94]|nr:repressor protein C [Rhizobium sp. L51/94]